MVANVTWVTPTPMLFRLYKAFPLQVENFSLFSLDDLRFLFAFASSSYRRKFNDSIKKNPE